MTSFHLPEIRHKAQSNMNTSDNPAISNRNQCPQNAHRAQNLSGYDFWILMPMRIQQNSAYLVLNSLMCKGKNRSYGLK